LPHSRDKHAKTNVIDDAAAGLRAAGFSVEVVIDEDTRRPFAAAEAERYERAADRADRYGERADRAAASSEAARYGADRIVGSYPLGQPILVGHHSERRHRRDLDRADRLMRRAIDETERSGYWADRADAAEHYRDHRESVPVTLRRIERLGAERRIYLRAQKGTTRTVGTRRRNHASARNWNAR
jgi:hypothetical protein